MLLLVSGFGLGLCLWVIGCIMVLVVVILVLGILYGVVVVVLWLVGWEVLLWEVFSGLISWLLCVWCVVPRVLCGLLPWLVGSRSSWLLCVVWPGWCGCVSPRLGLPLLSGRWRSLLHGALLVFWARAKKRVKST
jgi:hypothetical protein